jgi:hypothetical protein
MDPVHLSIRDPRWNALTDERVTLAELGLPPLADDDAVAQDEADLGPDLGGSPMRHYDLRMTAETRRRHYPADVFGTPR